VVSNVIFATQRLARSFLALEVVIERSLRKAGGVHNILNAGAVVPGLVEELERSLYYFGFRVASGDLRTPLKQS
jgi:hypothetical protein